MALNDTLHNGQADASSFVFAERVKTLKDSKKVVGILHIEADAVIGNAVDDCGRVDTFFAQICRQIRGLD